ncbi:YicC/YloC family endoribonuclease [uncultured Thiothrix sp.]|uniref:YicC/YloC family endoribonuclease n=1 Tax=uncultured Thiothrix sp. TaxID=223185 RepID=UPI0026148128|nr:YicC/YloC family endoribonuclease [uncultured Thiothrix sp.]HMT91344.1 YicC family protein [Thiolinea sp.]
MIRSMTAFAHHEISSTHGKLSWELRSVNHRYLDISLRVPEEFRSLENNFRTLLQNRLHRGKLEASLRYAAGVGENSTIVVNEPLARALIIACRQIEALTNNSETLKAVDILRWPGVTLDSAPDLEKLGQEAEKLLLTALDDLVATREREGKRLAEFIDSRCDQIAEILVRIRKRRPEIVNGIKDKIYQRLAELDVIPDNNRLEQELVILAQRLDVEEELDRLMAHLDEITAVLERDEPIGRRMDFLMQELNREANTLASKSNDAETTQAAVDLKVLIEQMREQIQNIE